MKTQTSQKSLKSPRKIPASATPLEVQKILVTTDFSDGSRAGVRYAITLVEKLNATVVLLHVVEPPARMAGMESVVLARTDAEDAGLARAQLANLAKSEVGSAVTVTTSVRTGKPFHEITTAAREGAADLIVIATHGHTGVERALLGSTAERVVRHAPCPVLIVPTRQLPKRAGKTRPFKLKKILVPIDFSTISKDALPYAVLLAGHFGAELVLLHIVEKFPIDYLLGGELAHQTTVPMLKQAEVDLERMAGELTKGTGVKTTVVIRDGKPFAEICDAAKTGDTDLIVLTTHGYTGLKHVWLGSTAERVVRHAPCPVLVVRELEHEVVSASPSPRKKSR